MSRLIIIIITVLYLESQFMLGLLVTMMWYYIFAHLQNNNSVYFFVLADMAADGTPEWQRLPDDVIVHILSYLPMNDRFNASLTCKAWSMAFEASFLWQHITLWFYLPAHRRKIQAVKKHGRYFKSVRLGCNQSITENRINTCEVLEKIAATEQRRLTSIKIDFTGENPLFYSGKEFLDSLSILFGPGTATMEPPVSLQHVDLSGLSVAYDDHVIDLLSLNNKHLRYLDIQNKILVCKVTADCILRLVNRCRKLEDLRLFHCSLSDDILKALAEDDRDNIKSLSVICRREEKYGSDLTSEAWLALASKIPSFRVTLGFDHTCPFNLIPVIMKPEIPVKTLRLETFTRIYEELNMATAYYKNTLQKVVLQTRNSVALENALLNLAEQCSMLRTLIVYCVVRQGTIDKIFDLHPDMRERGTYILKSEIEPEPWVVGVEEGD